MGKKLVLALALLLVSHLTFAADFSSTNVYFIVGGMDHKAAIIARDQARQKMFPTLPASQVQLLYISREGSMRDVYNTILANVAVDAQHATMEAAWVCYEHPLKCAIDYIKNPDVTYSAYKRQADYDAQVISSRPAYQALLGELYQNFSKGRKSFVISDSAGAAYANAAISFMQTHPTNYLSDPLEALCVGQTAIAPMTTYVASNSTNVSNIQLYATRPDDVIVQSVAAQYKNAHPSGPQILPPNLLSKIFGSDTSGHTWATYLNDGASYSIIADNIEKDMTSVNSKCPISTCKHDNYDFSFPLGSVSGWRNLKTNHELGTMKRQIRFNLHSVGGVADPSFAPETIDGDVYIVKAGDPPSKPIAEVHCESTNSYCDNSVTFNYDPAVLGTTKIDIYAFIDLDDGTKISVEVDCL